MTTSAVSTVESPFLPRPLREVELDHIRRTVEQCGGNRTEAAAQLGIGRNTLLRKLR